MTLPRFEYLTPASVGEALSLIGDDAVFVAGGTDLFVRMKERLALPKRVIGLENIAKLRSVKIQAKGGLRIGALVTLTDLAETVAAAPGWEFLRDAVELTSSPLLRNTGTIGGNLRQESRCTYYNQPPIFRKRWPLCFKLGGKVCHVVKGGKTCHAVYSGDLAGPLMALNAEVTIAGPGGMRSVAMEDFFTGSGLQPTVLGAGEILTEISIPKLPPSFGFSYQKLRLRDTIDYPLLGVSLFIACTSGKGRMKCSEARLALNAAGPSPVMVTEAEKLLKGKTVTEEAAEELGALVKKAAVPVANTASSPKYRRDMIPVLVRRALESVLAQAAKGSG